PIEVADLDRVQARKVSVEVSLRKDSKRACIIQLIRGEGVIRGHEKVITEVPVEVARAQYRVAREQHRLRLRYLLECSVDVVEEGDLHFAVRAAVDQRDFGETVAIEVTWIDFKATNLGC